MACETFPPSKDISQIKRLMQKLMDNGNDVGCSPRTETHLTHVLSLSDQSQPQVTVRLTVQYLVV